MLTDRANAICLLEILKEHSDAEHILPMRELLAKMNTIYGINIDRRTVYSAVALLLDLGFEISTFEENGKGYYLASREFEASEILLLTDAVYSFPFIPAKQSEQLIAKLQKQLSIHQRKQYRHLTIAKQERKTDNRQVFWNIEQLDEVISQKKQVSFTYLQYNLKKQLCPRREEAYVVTPFKLIYVNERYYLICSLSEHPDTVFYRIDRMQDIKILEQDADEIMDKAAVEEAVYAFAGQPEQIILHCNKIILDNVIDKFGMGVRLSEFDKQHFRASFTAPPRGVRYWALQYLPFVEVVEPKWLREEIIKDVQKNPYQK